MPFPQIWVISFDAFYDAIFWTLVFYIYKKDKIKTSISFTFWHETYFPFLRGFNAQIFVR